MLDKKCYGTPSSKEEIRITEKCNAPRGPLKEQHYTDEVLETHCFTCYDVDGRPWTYWNGVWQKAEDVGNPNTVVSEKPVWAGNIGVDDPREQALPGEKEPVFVEYATMFKVEDPLESLDCFNEASRKLECVNCKMSLDWDIYRLDQDRFNGECPDCRVLAKDFYKYKPHRNLPNA